MTEPVSLSPLSFSLRTLDAGTTIQGQGHVRWFSPETQRAGIEFHYLAPESRVTALAHIATRGSNSYIPL